jgi:hypothetical protein
MSEATTSSNKLCNNPEATTSNANASNIIELNAEELQLLNNPIELFSGEAHPWIQSNAYLFGKLYPFNRYKKICTHENDVAQTGLIDITGITGDELKKLDNYNLWTESFDLNLRKFVSWNSQPHVNKARRIISERILFCGDTDHGDVGATLLVHRMPDGAIDSIIIMSYSDDELY